MIKVFLLLLASNIIILVTSILRANFVDSVNLSIRSLLDPRFWMKNPALFTILGLYAIWFFTTMLASRSASVASHTRLTASLYTTVSLGIASVFTLINLASYQALRNETITPKMWTWATLAIICTTFSCTAFYMFLTEGQKVIAN